MDYEVALAENGTYVCVRVMTAITAELAMQFVRDAFELGRQHGIRKLLADERGCRSLSSISEKYAFAYSKGQEIGLSAEWQIALLEDEDNASVEFLETVLLNAGYNCRIFSDEDRAIAWLEDRPAR